MTAAGRVWRALPTLLRVGVAESVAYRAEFLIWLLTTTLPLVMLALWTEVARDGPIGGYSSGDFVAYYLAAFIVRQLTGVWVAWDMNRDIKEGTISMRLLKPLHPLWAYAAENVAVLPLRLLLALPVAVAALFIAGSDHLTHQPLMLALFAVSVIGGWLLSFGIMSIIGALAFYIDSTLLVFEIWFGLFTLCSGYLLPLSLFPRWLQGPMEYLPFRPLLGLPVEILVGRLSVQRAVIGVGVEFAYVVASLLLGVWVFQRGTRRYQAFGA